MKLRFQSLPLLIGLLCLPFTSFAREWTTSLDEAELMTTQPGYETTITELGLGHYRIRLDHISITSEPVALAGKTWSYLHLAGANRLWNEGAPSLPAISQTIRLANTGGFDVEILHSEFIEQTTEPLLPQQSIAGKSNEFLLENAYYTSSAMFPENLINTSDPAILRDARIAIVQTCPVQYQPSTSTLRIYQSIEFEIIPNNSPSLNELTAAPKPIPAFAGLYRDIIGAQDLIDENSSALPGQILVIARNDASLSPLLNAFTNWKTQAGRKAVVMAPLNAGSSPTDIKQIIDTAYANWNPPLESVILIGDGGNSGAMNLPSYSFGTTYSDHEYSLTAGGDILSDIIVTRMSVTSTAELWTAVNRTINYERNPPTADTTWFTRGWGYAGVSNNVLSNRPAIQFCLNMMRDGGVTNTSYDEHSGRVSASLINTRLSPGAMFWSHRPAWVGEISASDISGLGNNNKPFFSFNLSCNTGDWFGTSTGIQEALTRLGTPSAPRGAITAMSTSLDLTGPPPNNVIATGTMYGFGALNLRTAGALYMSGKYQLWRNFQVGAPLRVENFSKWNNVMGDGSALLWTGVPHAVNANIPATLAIGANAATFQVTQGGQPYAGALVTAWKSSPTNETYVSRYTNDQGYVTLPLTNQTAGELYITITDARFGKSILPLRDTISITASPFDLTLGATICNDNAGGGRIGNGDGFANPGETFDLNLYLRNRGTLSASGITGTLTSSDNRVSVVTGSSGWANCAPGDSSLNAGTLRLQLLSTLRDGEIIPLQLTVNSAQGAQLLAVFLQIHSLHISYRSSAISGAPQFTPGSTVQLATALFNDGGVALSSPTNVTLTSLHPLVDISNATVSFAAIPRLVEFTNPANQNWTITASRALLPGSQISFRAVFVNGSITDTITFSIPCGTRLTTQPTGPDAYGYSAYDQSDAIYPARQAFSWVEIIPASGGEGIPLALPDTSENRDVSIAVRLPFVAQMYGAQFDSVTICSNGWLAFGVQTQFNNFRNWHLPATEGPRYLVAPLWDDHYFRAFSQGVYTLSDTENHRFIVTWNSRMLGYGIDNTFQVIIYDPNYYRTPTNDSPIKFQYLNYRVAGGDPYEPNFPSTGISNGNYTDGIEYSFWNVFTPGSATIPYGTSVNRCITFSTLPPDTLLHLVYPSSSSILPVGQEITIEWCGRNGLSTVDVELNRDYPNGNWEPIAIATANDRSCTWTVSGAATTNARFRVRNGSEFEVSRQNITISVPGSPHIVVTPNPAQFTLPANNTYTRQVTINNTGELPFTGTLELTAGTTGFNYSTSADPGGPTYSWIDCTGAPMGPWSTDITTDGIALPFRFPFYGSLYDSVWMCTNGWLALDNPNESATYSNRTLPTTQLGAFLAVLWERMTIPEGNTRILLDANNQRAVFSWQNVQLYNQPTTSLWFQIVLFANGTIRYNYRTLNTGNTWGQNVGLQNSNRSSFFNVNNQTQLTTNFTVEFHNTTPWATADSTTFAIPAGGSSVVMLTLDTRVFGENSQAVGSLRFTGNANNTPLTIPLIMDVSSSSPEPVALPSDYPLLTNYPNPFNPTTTIQYNVRSAGNVSVELYNVMGEHVATLTNGWANAGVYQLSLNGAKLSGGVYFVTMRSGTDSITRKMILLK